MSGAAGHHLLVGKLVMSVGAPGPKPGPLATAPVHPTSAQTAGRAKGWARGRGAQERSIQDRGSASARGGPLISRKDPQNPLELSRKGQQSCPFSLRVEGHLKLLRPRALPLSTLGQEHLRHPASGEHADRVGRGACKEPICSLFPPSAPPGYGPCLSPGCTVGWPRAPQQRGERD